MLFGKGACLFSFIPCISTPVKEGWVAPDRPKVEWDKTAKDKFNANNKVVNAIFYGVSLEEFHRMSHVDTTKEAWDNLRKMYAGTKKSKVQSFKCSQLVFKS